MVGWGSARVKDYYTVNTVVLYMKHQDPTSLAISARDASGIPPLKQIETINLPEKMRVVGGELSGS